jgi:site-specific DNA recombinase
VQAELARLNLTTKPYATPRGRAVGGLSFARGHLYKILSNPLYIGEIEHKRVRYPGQHPPLIDGATWDAVQAQLAANHHENRVRTNAKSKSPLAGLIYDDAGNRLVSSHATKNGKRYRYYVTSEGTGRSVATVSEPRLWLPAASIDELVLTKLQSFLTDKAQISTLLRETRCRPAQIGSGLGIASKFADSLTSATSMAQNVVDLLARVTVSPTRINISFKRDRLLAMLTDTFLERSQDKDQDDIISLEATIPAAPGGGSGKLVLEDQNGKTPDAVVVKAIARASVWFEQLAMGKSQSMAEIALRENITDNYVSNLIHLAWLSPDLVSRVLDGDVEATALARTAMLTRKSDALWDGDRRKTAAAEF